MTQVLITEEELRGLLIASETRAKGFKLIVEMYSAQIYWQLRRMVYNHDDANDLVQNTFIKAWEGLDNFRGEAKVSTWLYSIAFYEGLGHLRQQQRKQAHLFNSEDEALTNYLLNQLESDTYFDGDEYEQKFQEALLSLPEKQALVFRLRYYDELPYEEISQMTGTSVGALKASYHHAVKKIEALLKQDN